MARSLEITGGRVLGLKDGVSFFDTDAYPVQFYPPENVISITGQTITFPDFHHTNAYGFVSGDTGGGVIKQSCHSFVSIPFQEWGPSDAPGITDTLDDIVIGTVPDGTDIRLVRIKLTRTNAPDQVNGTTVPVEPVEGEWTNCDGGSLLLEFLWPIVRMIWIRKASASNGDGTTNLLLTRKQSIQKRKYTHWRSGNSPLSTGWTWGGTNGNYGHIVKSIESKGPSTVVGGVLTFRRGDGAACSLTDSSDFSSTYTADIEVLPGRSNIAPEAAGGGAGALQFFLADIDTANPNSTTHTYVDKFLGTAPVSGETRHVIVAVTAYRGASANNDISGVTINGVAATQVAKQRTTAGSATVISAIYIAAVPTDDEGDVVVSFSTAAAWVSQVDVYAAYNLASATADNTQVRSTPGTSNLTTVADGIAVAAFATRSTSGTQGVTGIGNVVREDWDSATPSVAAGGRFRGYQKTDGSTLAIVQTNTTGDAAFCAASFH